VDAQGRRSITLEIASSAQKAGVTLSGTIEGGVLEAATPSVGRCSLDPFECQLGTLAAQGSASVDLTVLGSDAVTVHASVASEVGCDSDSSDDAVSVAFQGGPPRAQGSSDDEGGCGCRASSSKAHGWLALAAAFGLLRRRRQVA
jgi:MYXO-CTERM domain-containing protein